MARYEITYSCGCIHQKHLYGKIEQRDRFIVWAAKDGTCDDCQKFDVLDHAGTVEAEYGLPDLFGTAKQIDWARRSRAKLVPEVIAYLESKRAMVPGDKMVLFEGQVSRVVVGMCGKRGASWWIDRRQSQPSAVAGEVFAEARR